MSIILLVIMMIICENGVPIDDVSLILLGLLFVGDCILASRRGK